jgi:hypothetical protein
LAPARQRFEANAGLNVIGSTGDPRSLELFLLYFCAIGAQMTEPVEGWIHRAGDRCAALGFSELAEGLRKHARAESGHHLMMVADLWSLTNHWNTRHTPRVRAEDLVRQEPSPGALRYRQVHEDNIAGDTPYAQIAIEYEIERLPLLYATNPALKTHLSLAATIGLQLAAGAGVLALALANHAAFSNGLVFPLLGLETVRTYYSLASDWRQSQELTP